MLQKVEFKQNVPVDLALRFTDGINGQGQFGPYVRFTTSDGRAVFLPPVAADRIRALNLQPDQPVRIVKASSGAGKSVEWKVEKLGERPDGTFAVPKQETGAENIEKTAPAQAAAIDKPQPVNGHGTNFHGSQGRYIGPLPDAAPIADRLRTTVNMLVDVQGDCLEHAKKYNGGVRPEDVRAILLTAYIGMSKGTR